LNPTPNIDRLAREGMRFDRAYVGNSICAPSRATLLTGMHSHINGKLDNRGGFNHEQQQFQKILQKHGYQTAMIGKIHLDGRMQGFDYWDVLEGQGNYNDPEFFSDAGKSRASGYTTDIITDKALDWLEHKRDVKKPFMLMIHHKAPQGKELVRWKYQLYMRDYLRCIWAVDENIGRVLQALEDQGLINNTIVMYSSDQGFYMGEHGWFDKRFMYEESFRTPLIARWPGKIKPGSVNTDLVQNIDFAETFLELAGSPIPSNMQGRSIVPLLEGKTPEDWRKSLYYHYYEYPVVHSVRRHEGVFDGRYKLIRFYGQDVPSGEEWELFDLENDPNEMNSVYSNPESLVKITSLKSELDRLKELYEVPGE
ncbi:MAG: sulfatase, partial [Verrucomicrobia bacterium]|nr:sulfatase [Verrucomicrobiota bacterium]